jgi:hypothetical protein
MVFNATVRTVEYIMLGKRCIYKHYAKNKTKNIENDRERLLL